MAGVANKEYMGELYTKEEVSKVTVSTVRRGPKTSIGSAVSSTGYKHCHLCEVNQSAERLDFEVLCVMHVTKRVTFSGCVLQEPLCPRSTKCLQGRASTNKWMQKRKLVRVQKFMDCI